ncbi:Bug family tripartite tricarboxylate transporter substrate binding protein [Bordetella flabilis]|uniref:ABC transporter substrate-binding protein n=1 Tax=Bordetella flabilis TaxID=463014 RepID=A0A193G9E9_9BORD|nr:tripartite tricarboxylate transporter substrate binding protein [Bordetella flabilis]ANN76096.1 ABC transporter substrate-binding protein [Bordetella flabilis]
MHGSRRKSAPARLCAVAFATLAAVLSIPAGAQQAYPNKPITFIVPYAAGGSSDTRSRQLAQKLGDLLKVPVVVENKPGASGNIGTAQITRAQPDGYTIGLGNFAPLSVNKALYAGNLGFDPDKDIQPVVLIERGAMVLGVNRNSPYKDLDELIKTARANPDKLNYASTGAGGASHLTTELFKSSVGINATHVPYRGGAPAVNDLMAGNVDFYIELASLFMPYAEGDAPRLRLLAVASEKRLAALPDVPTFREAGVADMVVSNWFGVIAPAGTPDAIVRMLNDNINRVLQDPDYKRTVESQGAEVAGGTPADFKAFIADESRRWGGLIAQKHITLQ